MSTTAVTPAETPTDTAIDTAIDTAAVTPADGRPALAAPRPPVAAPPSSPIAVALAVLLVAAGAVLIRDALAALQVIAGPLWTTRLLTSVDGFRAQPWLVPVGAFVALAGLWWLICAVRPRRRTEVAVGDSGMLWTRPVDLARLATFATSGRDGVVEARARANRRTVTVTLRTTANDSTAIRQDVADVVTRSLASARPSPSVRVRTIGVRP